MTCDLKTIYDNTVLSQSCSWYGCDLSCQAEGCSFHLMPVQVKETTCARHHRWVSSWHTWCLCVPSQRDSFGKHSVEALESCPVPLITRRIMLYRRLTARAKRWHAINTTKLATFSLLAHQPNANRIQGDSHSCFIKIKKTLNETNKLPL